MCELFGFTGSEKHNIADMLQTLRDHSGLHPNGWGLALLDPARTAVFHESIRAKDSRLLGGLLAAGVSADLAIAHIRLATIGSVTEDNCHPFVREDVSGRIWTLAHNGTIFDFPDLQRFYDIDGCETDSACVLAWLTEQINQQTEENNGPLSQLQLNQVISDAIAELAPHNKLNLLFSDGAHLYVHTNMVGTLFMKKIGSGMAFATVPLDYGGWVPVPMNKLHIFKKGEHLWSGSAHHGTYVKDDAQTHRVIHNYVVF